MHEQAVKIVDHAGHGGGIAPAPLVSEGLGVLLGHGDGRRARLRLAHLEDGPVVGLELGVAGLGDLGERVAAAVDRTPLAQASPKCMSIAAINPGAPSLICSSGGFSPRRLRSARKSSQASIDSEVAGARPTKTGLPLVSMPHAASTGSALAPSCILKWLPSRNK